ncbi:hypothetical protein [Methanoculleus sp.]|uniref:hypothetical protein n=1 Tax=Methanoculleus sp. TaxID=90427 RepID=UPI0025F1B5FC|nr:hypothetical protein [Methanoculleus sp.]
MKNSFVLIGSLVLVCCLPLGAYLSGDPGCWEPANPAEELKLLQPIYTKQWPYLLKAGLNKREPVIFTLGGLPSSKGGKSASYSDLENVTEATWGMLRERHLYPTGNVIGFGYGVEGYLEVTLWNGPPRPETTYSVEALHVMVDEQARAVGIEDVPVRFTVRTSPPIVILD